MEEKKKFDLEDRLVEFSGLIIQVSEKAKKNYAGNHLSNQIVRSDTSPALQYGEAQAAESRNDFVHKLKILLKELRETKVNLRILVKANLINDEVLISNAMSECDQLIAIFIKSIDTANRNSKQ